MPDLPELDSVIHGKLRLALLLHGVDINGRLSGFHLVQATEPGQRG